MGAKIVRFLMVTFLQSYGCSVQKGESRRVILVIIMSLDHMIWTSGPLVLLRSFCRYFFHHVWPCPFMVPLCPVISKYITYQESGFKLQRRQVDSLDSEQDEWSWAYIRLFPRKRIHVKFSCLIMSLISNFEEHTEKNCKLTKVSKICNGSMNQQKLQIGDFSIESWDHFFCLKLSFRFAYNHWTILMAITNHWPTPPLANCVHNILEILIWWTSNLC